MPRTTPSKAIILSLLTEGSTRASDLAVAANISYRSVKSVISRLRDDGFLITSESTETSGDPRYRLLSGPGSLSAAFICPKCRATIRLGEPQAHKETCPYGLPSARNLSTQT